MACDDRALLKRWMGAWEDLVDFEVHAVITGRGRGARGCPAVIKEIALGSKQYGVTHESAVKIFELRPSSESVSLRLLDAGRSTLRSRAVAGCPTQPTRR
jgi:hypothetical protein